MRRLILLIAVALAVPAQAAELETIVVHGSRLGTSTQQPTILTESEIEARRAYHAGDIMRALPGQALSQPGNPAGQTQAPVPAA
ncbi:MAG: hypothetical protein OXT64_05945, partial [Gammaproteobacteria bacterium]|nr:hypothetical protein [Gammaproteobacteria bacterium]